MTDEETRYCPRCDEEVQTVEKEWEYGPPGIHCSECGRDLTLTGGDE